MSGVNPQSSREKLTQLSTDVVPTQTQMSGFVKNSLLETRNLQISNEKFLTEVICDEHLDSFFFRNLSLINLNFTNIDFESSFF